MAFGLAVIMAWVQAYHRFGQATTASAASTAATAAAYSSSPFPVGSKTGASFVVVAAAAGSVASVVPAIVAGVATATASLLPHH